MVVYGPAKSGVVVRIRSQPWPSDEMVNMSYLGCEFYGFDSHEGHFLFFEKLYIYILYIYIMLFSPLEQFDSVLVVYFRFFGYDFSVTSIIVPLILAIIFIKINYSFNFSIFSLVPTPIQYIYENLLIFILDLIVAQIGKKGLIYLPLILTLFIFVLSCNLLSMSPFGIALTSHLIIILFLSLSLGLSNFILVFIHMVFLFWNYLYQNALLFYYLF